ncbi:MAG: hypothetical protein HY599_01690 [Candidatus Omnitrophica bacterium]|nr:hypothetical protein [Candidatus Omnitrophota bacterium]
MIRGHVTGVQSAWDGQHRAIWTTATVAIEEVLRGSLNPTTSIQVKEVGGSVGDYTIKAEGFPTFRQDEEVVLLLQPWEDGSGAYHVWGYGRGMFVVSHRDNRAPTAARYDVVETGRATMLTDRLAPEAVLDQLSRELRGLARSCDAGASP